MHPAKQVPGPAASFARDVPRRRGEQKDKQVDGFGVLFTAPTPQPVQVPCSPFCCKSAECGAQGLRVKEQLWGAVVTGDLHCHPALGRSQRLCQGLVLVRCQ